MALRAESMTVTLKEAWLGRPAGSKLNLVKYKAEDLINRGVAEKPKTKKVIAPKNRAITTNTK